MIDKKDTIEKDNFELNLNKLKEVVNLLEEGNISLEDSLKLFEEGIGIYRKCNEVLENAEQKISLLLCEEGIEKEIPFDMQEED